ncbi:hypothetical protein M2407_005225 [Serratia sp. BIGb0234]|nr:hypothetical protein [Serratia sp. BIGb0234]
MSIPIELWVFRNLGGVLHGRGLITRRLSNSNPARPYICRFSIFRRFTCPSTTPLLHLLVDTAAIARDNLYFRIFSEPSGQRTLIATGKQNEGTVSIKIDY